MSANSRPLVCVQGLGYVGAAMALAIAEARRPGARADEAAFEVVGVDVDSVEGRRRISELNQGRFPFAISDGKLAGAARRALERGNFRAGSDGSVYERASVVVVDVPFHIEEDPAAAEASGVDVHSRAETAQFLAALREVGDRIPADALVLVESTVPPGACEHWIAPQLQACFEARGIREKPLLAHSYERVMPGPEYLDSIRNFWRVFAGASPAAARRCRQFLETVVNTEEYPLAELHSTTASETAKALENSFRATTIAMMEEWGRFAEHAGVDLHQVIDAIRVRPTHANLRQPGFGVGGYCLTKDPLLVGFAAREIFDAPELRFPFSLSAVRTNRQMPMSSLERLESLLDGSLSGKRVLLCGISYRSEVGDTRFSPSESFVHAARERGAELRLHDPWVSHWGELALDVPPELPRPSELDAVVLAVPHREYLDFDWPVWVEDDGEARPIFLDANRVLSDGARAALRTGGCRVESVGRGSGL